MTKAITPNFLFYISLLNAKETNKKFPSRNEVAFLGDSGASISVLNLSKHTMISRLGFFVDTRKDSKIVNNRKPI